MTDLDKLLDPVSDFWSAQKGVLKKIIFGVFWNKS